MKSQKDSVLANNVSVGTKKLILWHKIIYYQPKTANTCTLLEVLSGVNKYLYTPLFLIYTVYLYTQC